MSDRITRICVRTMLRYRSAMDRAYSAASRTPAARDDGNSTEQVIIIALLAALAITVISIIAAKVIAKANSINL